jgi:hypothetical protein
MPSTGTAPALAKERVNATSHQSSHKPKREVPVSARQGARCFLWIAGLVFVNSVFGIMSSQVHLFVGLGLAEVVGGLDEPSRISFMQAIVSFWVAGGFLFLGYLALKGRKWAFAAGMAAYEVDAVMMVAVGDYLGAVFHGLMLYGMYRGLVALGQSRIVERPERASAAHAG